MTKQEKPKTTEELKSFGEVMALVLFVLAMLPLARARMSGIVLTGVGFGFLIPSIVAPRSLAPIEKLWMAFGEKMSVVMTTIILAATYYIVLTPLGIIMRLTGRDSLKRKLDREAKSYWEPVPADGPGSRPDVPY